MLYRCAAIALACIGAALADEHKTLHPLFETVKRDVDPIQVAQPSQPVFGLRSITLYRRSFERIRYFTR